MVGNLALQENGGSIFEFSSQYHHESRCSNLLQRDPCLVWFTSVEKPLPQYVIFKLLKPAKISRVGIFLHGENNQNPGWLEIHVSDNNLTYEKVVDEELEHRGGDFLFDLTSQSQTNFSQYVKFVVTKNFGGSGIYISKVYIFGQFQEL